MSITHQSGRRDIEDDTGCRAPASTAVAATVLRWCLEDVASAVSRRRTRGEARAKCPYVRATVNGGGLTIDVCEGIVHCDARLIEKVASLAHRFSGLGSPVEGPTPPQALICVLPRLTLRESAVFDTIVWQFRQAFVAAGLMLAPFYPASDRRSVRDPRLAVFTAPYPLIVVRDLAPHDSVFLSLDQTCLAAWEDRFRPLTEDRDVESGTRSRPCGPTAATAPKRPPAAPKD